MGTGKKIAIGCAGCVVLGVTIVAAFAGFFYFKRRQYDPQVRALLAEAMPVLATWDVEAFRYYWAEEVLDQMSSGTKPDSLLPFGRSARSRAMTNRPSSRSGRTRRYPIRRRSPTTSRRSSRPVTR
jgi:hypothetical protein